MKSWSIRSTSIELSVSFSHVQLLKKSYHHFSWWLLFHNEESILRMKIFIFRSIRHSNSTRICIHEYIFFNLMIVEFTERFWDLILSVPFFTSFLIFRGYRIICIITVICLDYWSRIFFSVHLLQKCKSKKYFVWYISRLIPTRYEIDSVDFIVSLILTVIVLFMTFRWVSTTNLTHQSNVSLLWWNHCIFSQSSDHVKIGSLRSIPKRSNDSKKKDNVSSVHLWWTVPSVIRIIFFHDSFYIRSMNLKVSDTSIIRRPILKRRYNFAHIVSYFH